MKQILTEWRKFSNEAAEVPKNMERLVQHLASGLPEDQRPGFIKSETRKMMFDKEYFQRQYEAYEEELEESMEMVEEEIEKLNEKPAKGKKSSKTYINPKTGRKNKTSYGQKGATISPGTSKGDSYCARSFGIKKGLPKSKQNDPNTANNLSRKKWKCKGAKSSK